MFPYLNKFRSSVGGSQGNYILNSLISKTSTGEIADIDEFRTELQKLTSSLSSKIQPSLKIPSLSSGSLMDNRVWNKFCEQLRNDLDTLFRACGTIDQVIESHKLLILLGISSVEYQIRNLEEQITVAEYINNQYLFTSGRTYSFLEKARTTDISDPRDFSTRVCAIDSSLLLPFLSTDLQIESNLIKSGEGIDQTEVSNLSDNSDTTAFSGSIQKIETSEVSFEVLLRFSGPTIVNCIKLNPLITIDLTRIDYVDHNNIRKTVWNSSQVIEDETIIYFPPVRCLYLIPVFSQKMYTDSHITSSSDLSASTQAIISQYYPLVSDQVTRMYKFDFGFREIDPKKRIYEKSGIYVGDTLSINPVCVGLTTEEVRPSLDTDGIVLYESTQSSSKFYSTYIEYYLECKFWSDVLLKTFTVPILPIGISEVIHERLYFSRRTGVTFLNDTAILRFYTGSARVVVYKNGQTFTDWSFVATDGDVTVTSPNSGSPMKRALKINRSNDSDVYTVSYTPTVSNTSVITSSVDSLVSYVDISGDLSAIMGPGNIIYFSKLVTGQKVKRIDVRPIVILRTEDQFLTPIVNRFTIFS